LEKLQKHFDDMQNATMQEMFQVDVTRTAKFHLKWNDFLIDYSKNIINQETMDLLWNWQMSWVKKGDFGLF
jgi:glucose-6-phosphate isomerase